MVRHRVQPVEIIEKNNYSVIRRSIKLRKPQLDEVDGRICSPKVCQTRVKRWSCDSAIFPLCRNTAFANFSKIVVLKRQLYRHRINISAAKIAGMPTLRNVLIGNKVSLMLCCTPLLLIFDIVILSKKFAYPAISKNLCLSVTHTCNAK